MTVDVIFFQLNFFDDYAKSVNFTVSTCFLTIFIIHIYTKNIIFEVITLFRLTQHHATCCPKTERNLFTSL